MCSLSTGLNPWVLAGARPVTGGGSLGIFGFRRGTAGTDGVVTVFDVYPHLKTLGVHIRLRVPIFSLVQC